MCVACDVAVVILTPGVDKDGRDITPPMDTPHTNTRSEFIQFGCDVHMQVPVEQLPVGMYRPVWCQVS